MYFCIISCNYFFLIFAGDYRPQAEPGEAAPDMARLSPDVRGSQALLLLAAPPPRVGPVQPLQAGRG